MMWILVVAAVLLSPGLALAGWRMGLRRRGRGEDVVTPRAVLLTRNPWEVRPRVRKAMYERQSGKK
jgi:hypothetical protein